MSAATINGVAQCSFQRPASITKEISDGEMLDFNLVAEDYFILQAFASWNSPSDVFPEFGSSQLITRVTINV